MAEQKVTVKRDEMNPEPLQLIAKSIIDISASMRVINTTRLNRRALVTLIHDHSKVSRRDIELVLDNLVALDKIWLRPLAGSK